MLTKDLLRVSRAGGGFHPQFTDDVALAQRVLGTYRDHVGEERGALDDALEDLERDADDYKLVRGFAKLLEREGVFETESPVEPRRARRAAFAAAEDVGVVTESERREALDRAADSLGADTAPGGVAASLYADREVRQVLTDFSPRWDAESLVAQYNLSLAQTALFDATEVRVRTTDPRALVSRIKRLGLLYEIRTVGDETEGREVVLTGPDALFRRSRRYGTRFARLLRTVAQADEWSLEATIDDRGTDRTMRLSDSDPVRVPGVDPVTDVSYDSGVEREFAARFESLDLDWELVREPDVLDAGERVMIPDFAFDYEYADFRVYFEVMGFWTPDYVEKKLTQLDQLEDVDMLVAVDESLGVGEDVETRDHRVVTYSGSVRIKDVVDELRDYEEDLVAASADAVPAELTPDADVVTLDDLAAEYGVAVDAVEGKTFPAHRLVGRTLVRPAVLDALAGELDAGMSLAEAEDVLGARGLSDASAALSELGYRVEWEGLGGGVLREKESDEGGGE